MKKQGWQRFGRFAAGMGMGLVIANSSHFDWSGVLLGGVLYLAGTAVEIIKT